MHLTARPARDALEERYVRKLAHSSHAPADWIVHAKMVAHSWEGLRTTQIAEVLHCHPQTVRERLHAFNDRGLDGLGMQPGSGRKPRLTQLERSTILALVTLPPPGKPTDELTGELTAPDPDAEPEWTLDTLTAAAHARGIQVARSQVRRIFLRERVRWRHTRLWATSKDPDFAPKGRDRRALHQPARRRDGPLRRRTRPGNAAQLSPAPGWSPDGHRITVPLDYERGPDTVWIYGALCVRDGQALTQTASARNTTTYRALLETLDHAYPQGDLYLVADNQSSHSSGPICEWLAAHPRIQHAFIPVGAAWLNLIEGWWRIFRRKAFAGQSLADDRDIAYVTRIATDHLNRQAQPWVWGRPPKLHRCLRRRFVYSL